MPPKWYDNWDESFDLAGGGEELNFRHEDISAMLVETEAVRKTRQLVSRISAKGVSSRYYFIGDKGYGKSTLLNYIAYSLLTSLDAREQQSKPVGILCPMLGSAGDEHALEFVFFNSLLKSLFEVPEDVKRLKIEFAKDVGISRLRTADKEYREALARFSTISLEFVFTALENQLRHLSESLRPIVFLLDGLDKFDPSVVLQFLRKSQERLSAFVAKYHCIFVFAADPKWAETLETHEFTGIKGSPIRLRGWTFDEVWVLIEKRLEAIGIYVPPFGKDAVEQLVADFQGNPRKILQYATLLLHFGAKQHLESIGPGVARQVVWTEDQKESLHNRIIQDPQFRYAYEKLRGSASTGGLPEVLIACFTKGVLRRTMNYDERASLGIRLKDDDFARGIQTLVDSGCLKYGATEDFVQLENDVKALFEFVKNARASLEALPAVFEEYEARISSIPLPPKEDVVIGGEVKSVFQSHSRGWLNAQSVASYIFQDPRKAQAMRERFGSQAEEKLVRSIPLIMAQFRREGHLVYDQFTGFMRWRGLVLDKELGEIFLCREIVESYEDVKLAAERESPGQVTYACQNALTNAIDLIMKQLSQEPTTTKLERKLTLLERLNVDLRGAIPLDTFFEMISRDSTIGPDSIGIVVETCRLYLTRIAEKSNEIKHAGPIQFMSMILDPPYNARVDVVGQKIAIMVNTSLRNIFGQDWISGVVDPKVAEKAKYRLKTRVPEDPRTNNFEFLTLGELRDLMRREKIWAHLKEIFVNVPNRESDVNRFNSDELFFGSLELLIDYRNPPSHAAFLMIEKSNKAMIESALTKLERILGVPS